MWKFYGFRRHIAQKRRNFRNNAAHAALRDVMVRRCLTKHATLGETVEGLPVPVLINIYISIYMYILIKFLIIYTLFVILQLGL